LDITKDTDADAHHLNYCEQVLQNDLVEDILQNNRNDIDNSQHLLKFRRFQQMAQIRRYRAPSAMS
jgi:hypothetical protein